MGPVRGGGVVGRPLVRGAERRRLIDAIKRRDIKTFETLMAQHPT